MAALALPAARPLLPAFRLPFARPIFAGAFLPALQVAPKPFGFSLQSAWESLIELIPPFLLAVPKKKVSHSRKSMRSANKGLKDKQNLVHCPGCGSAKLAHHLCPNCYSSINRGFKARSKESGQPSGAVVEIAE
ncbi:hypothetical protein PHLGIDRAFT_124415 [Phlebiopsis gigantea 11061_1 CR5-6]|uniref:Large ribosomal subunit protein bL32m n=1 Tax=Phlebiopsis gigantea (strain 11061_1 CR5-6) TaxID=745531 RepID=A0A0C3SDM8_PHLG1|nr:hypothetical protein PHLGIDRAFT_124415 [Phlebiopsis gigantea 11061_1 CR5-6]